MQDLSQYQKKDHVVISSRYVTPLVVGSITIVGLVFALGVLVGGKRIDEGSKCLQPDLLAKLNEQSNEPELPEKMNTVTFHKTLSQESRRVPLPASLKNVKDEQGENVEEISESEELENVSLKTPRETEEVIPERIRDEEADVFTLQVGSFQDHKEASLMVNRLQKAGHRSFLVKVNMPEQGGIWYRVRVGPFSSKKEAWAYKDAFESKERLPAFVVKRRS